jgi:hypothetical protein
MLVRRRPVQPTLERRGVEITPDGAVKPIGKAKR